MPFPWIWCIFFFLMMVTIGFGSLLSMAECVLDSFIFLFDIKLRKNKTIFRFGMCMLFFLIGCSMTTKGGYYLLNIVESYSCTLPIILCSTLEAVCLCWFYGKLKIFNMSYNFISKHDFHSNLKLIYNKGTERIKENIKLMISTDLNIYWRVCFKFFTPVLAIVREKSKFYTILKKLKKIIANILDNLLDYNSVEYRSCAGLISIPVVGSLSRLVHCRIYIVTAFEIRFQFVL